MDKGARIYVAGHRGMVGSALVRELRRQGYRNLVLRDRRELDLTDQAAVRRFFEEERPQVVFLAAARVGGILANRDFPADFIHQNLLIQGNVIDSAWRTGVRDLLFLGSSCIYPKFAPQPMCEEYLLTGELEPTNEPYAVAKIAGIKTCQAFNRQYGTRFLAVMPTNLYGPGDNFDLAGSHVLPALLRKFHEARQGGQDGVEIWGTGQPRREFLHVDDLAAACLHVMKLGEGDLAGAFLDPGAPGFLNVGTGRDVSIRELAELIREIVGFRGELRFDPSKPDGTPRKLLDVSRLQKLGWEAEIGLREGIEATYRWFSENRGSRD